MQVLPINKSFAPSFGGIRSRGNFTEQQSELDYKIKTLLKTESNDYNNKTPEQYYQHKGYDIGITPLPDGEKVNISLYERTKGHDILNQESFFSRKRTDLGDYSSSEELNAKMKEKYNASRGFLNNNLGILSFIAAAILLAGISQIKGAKAAALQTTEKVGNTIDSIYTKVADILIKQK